MRAIRINQPGGPEVLQLEETEVPRPGPGQVLIKVAAAGVNYADLGLRQGMSFGPHRALYPVTPGYEVAGTIAALGADVAAPVLGTRVAAVVDDGGYAEYAVAAADRAWAIPEGLDDASATVLLVQGLTAYGVIHDAARVQPGEGVLVQAATGGVGSIAVQLCCLAGARPLLGTAGGARKCQAVRDLGTDAAIDYTQPDWTAAVYAATGGRGVDVVLESVGGPSGGQAFGSLAPLGRMVTFGAASGQPLPMMEIMMPLAIKGLSLIGFGGPWLRPGRAAAAWDDLIAEVGAGRLRLTVGHRFALSDAAEAHRAVAARETIGKVVLMAA